MNQSIKRTVTVLTALICGAALAHATVKTDAGGSESLAGKYETYRLQVPTEKDIPTVRVRLVLPEGVQVSSFMPVPGFVRSVERDAQGHVSAVSWAGRIQPEEFQRFLFSVRNPAEAATLAWTVEQTYQDGTVVHWDDHDPATPASKTSVK